MDPFMGDKKPPRKSRSAAALKYDPKKDPSPVLVAAGKGRIAEEIIKRARDAGVPIQKDPVLVETLCHLDIGQFIPPELYQAVAEVLVFIMTIDSRQKKIKSKGKPKTLT